jgi:hypothetical protein
LEAEYELAVGGAIQPGRGVDARDPQLPELALALAAVAVLVIQRVEQALAGLFPEPMATATLALHHSHDFVMAAA